jgi:hypothetical protein
MSSEIDIFEKMKLAMDEKKFGTFGHFIRRMVELVE